MQLFLSTYVNKIDKKGRVSVPSSFRAVLSGQVFVGIIAYGSVINECVEACGFNRIEQLNNSIDQLDVYSEARDALATIILGGSIQLGFDSEGRVTLSDELMTIAKLDQEACFVGKGTTFEIWQPELFQQHLVKARALAKDNRFHLNNNGGQTHRG